MDLPAQLGGGMTSRPVVKTTGLFFWQWTARHDKAEKIEQAQQMARKAFSTIAFDLKACGLYPYGRQNQRNRRRIADR
ncbi:hypothetical protein [Hoeflea prorocentri]|uniref:Uncharacterized protein n=1 Tax=Hoeflea prorocentri TaxID=1922333 RepID=A0A9X3ZJX6_9HYPH|nr:hypothetical protein [Hoeflea prorocentri]MCY6383461.1 hypothetical protein [Hoeflea prorocentri]MDA5401261.1 hypothetical protein [Hoeflea prorocentri]